MLMITSRLSGLSRLSGSSPYQFILLIHIPIVNCIVIDLDLRKLSFNLCVLLTADTAKPEGYDDDWV